MPASMIDTSSAVPSGAFGRSSVLTLSGAGPFFTARVNLPESYGGLTFTHSMTRQMAALVTILNWYDPTAKVLWIIADEKVCADDINATFGQLVETTDHPLGVDTVWDLGGFDFQQAGKVLFDNFYSVRKSFPERQKARIVLVADSDLGFGMCRDVQIKCETEGSALPDHIHVARTTDEAIDWLISMGS